MKGQDLEQLEEEHKAQQVDTQWIKSMILHLKFITPIHKSQSVPRPHLFFLCVYGDLTTLHLIHRGKIFQLDPEVTIVA